MKIQLLRRKDLTLTLKYSEGRLRMLLLTVDNEPYPPIEVLHYNSRNGEDFKNNLESSEDYNSTSLFDRENERREQEELTTKMRNMWFEEKKRETYNYYEQEKI